MFDDKIIYEKLESIQKSTHETEKVMVRVESKLEGVTNDVESLRSTVVKVEAKLVEEVERLKYDVAELKQTNRVLKWILGICTALIIAVTTAAAKGFFGW